MRSVVLASLALAVAAPPAAAVPLRADLTGCETGPERADREATFRASMPDRADAAVLSMRFVLQRATSRGWRALAAPSFDRWERSRPGAAGFRFQKTVSGLYAPGRFRVRVRFVWRDANGRAVARAARASRTCVQPDWRPDLRVEALTARPALGGAVEYAATILNAGRGAVDEPFDVVLGLAGQNHPPRQVERLAARARTTVRFVAPACRPGETVRVTADAARVIRQPRRADDVLDARCPL